MKCGQLRLGPSWPTGFSKVTGIFLTGNRSVVISVGSGSTAPAAAAPPTPLSGPGRSAGCRGAVKRQENAWREPVVLQAGGGAGSCPPPRFRARALPPPLAPCLALPCLPSPPRGEEGGVRSPPPGQGACVRPPPLPSPRPGSPGSPRRGVSRKSSERGRTTERTETSSSPYKERPDSEVPAARGCRELELRKDWEQLSGLGSSGKEVRGPTFHSWRNMCSGGGTSSGRAPDAPGGVKRRAVEALTELKWAGKPGADSPWLTPRTSLPTPWGRAKKKRQKRVPFLCFLGCCSEETSGDSPLREMRCRTFRSRRGRLVWLLLQ